MKLVIFVIVISILINYLITKKEKNKNEKLYYTYNNSILKNTSTNTIEYNKYYKSKRYLTTLNEIELYKILNEIANKYNLLVLSQVVLYEIIEVSLNKYDKEYLKYFNKIKSKSIDFVIVNRDTTRILQCIELDDTTHNSSKRIARDKFINELFNSLDIPLLRIKVKNRYNKNYLEEIISKTCTDKIYARE